MKDWRRNRLFDGFESELLDCLEPFLSKEHYPEGAAIIREGDGSERLFLVCDGIVAIHKGEERLRIGEVVAGDYFGEMGLFTGDPRTSSASAHEDVHILSLSRSAMDRFREETGVDLLKACLKNHAEVLGDRLQGANEKAVASMRRQMDEYRIRSSFGSLFANLVFMLFFYISALDLLRRFADAGISTTMTTSVMILFMALLSAWIIRNSGFPLHTFGLTMARWRWVLGDALVWTLVFCAVATIAKWVAVTTVDAYGELSVIDLWVSPRGLWATLMVCALYVVLSPVQEFIARGMLQGSLQKLLAGRNVTLKAVILSNAVFSISHQHLGVGYALIVFLPGLFWGWMYHRQGSLLGVSLSHIIIGIWVTVVLDLESMFL